MLKSECGWGFGDKKYIQLLPIFEKERRERKLEIFFK